MSYGHLLKTQANDVLNAIRQHDLEPENFAWDPGPTLTLRCKPSEDYFFRFELVDYGQHQGQYCPGDDTAYEDCRGGDWNGQLSLVETWVMCWKPF